MPTVIGVGTRVPPHKITQETVRDFARRLFDTSRLDVDRLMPVFANTTIRERFFCMDMDWFTAPHGFAEKNRAYQEKGIELAQEAVLAACRTADIPPGEIDHILFVSTTGVATPSLDAHLFNRLQFKASILRTPIWGLGCGGGVAGMARAADWLKANPDRIALVVSLELCGLTFIKNDQSKSNFIATALFGDGCGALLMAGDGRAEARRPGPGLEIEATGSVTWPDSLEVMGWDIADEGFKVLFSKSIPQIVQHSARPAILEFLGQNGAALEEIRHFLSHPGGAKVIEAYQKALGFDDRQVSAMREVLAGFGNMSSATVFFVLKQFLDSADYRPGDRILSAALGPGFFSEMLLARCR